MSEKIQLSAIGVFIQNHHVGKFCLSHQLSLLDTYGDTIFHTKNFQKISIPHPFHMPVCISHHLSEICHGYGSGDILAFKVSILTSYHTFISFHLF